MPSTQLVGIFLIKNRISQIFAFNDVSNWAEVSVCHIHRFREQC